MALWQPGTCILQGPVFHWTTVLGERSWLIDIVDSGITFSKAYMYRIPLRSRKNFHGLFSSVLPHSSGAQDSARQQTQLVEHSMAWQCSPVGPWSWLLTEVVALDKNHCRAGCQSSSLKLTYSLNRAPHSPSTMRKSTSSLRVHSVQSSLTSLTPKRI